MAPIARLLFLAISVGLALPVIAQTKSSDGTSSAQPTAEIDAKGRAKASASKYKYRLASIKDQMTGKETLVARFTQAFGKGSVEVKVYCGDFVGDSVLQYKFAFDNVNVPKARREINSKNYWITEKKLRINGRVEDDTFLNERLSDLFEGLLFIENNRLVTTYQTKVNGKDVLLPEVIWDYAVQIPTEDEPFYVEINPYDPAIKKVIESCKAK